MRALTVLGLTEDGTQLCCEDEAGGERFTVPVDDQLRTVLRGVLDTAVPRTIRTEPRESTVEPQLRPRDIQARIRAGANLAEVAAEAGCDEQRIERFAYPVLMERGAMAQRARAARTMLGGTLSTDTVEQLALRTLSDRGQSASATWDAYREETGGWVLTLTWYAGHTDNVARWSIHSGGGTVSALDDAAATLLDPAPRPLRRVPEAQPEPQPETPVNPLVLRREETAAAEPADAAPAAAPPAVGTSPSAAGPGRNKVAAALASREAAPAENQSAAAHTPVHRTGTDDARPARSGKKPAMPSWEDVLLGTRSSGR